MTENRNSKMNLEQERRIAELPRTGAQDCGTPGTGEPTGEPLLCGQGGVESGGSGNLSRHSQKHPLQDDT